MALKDFGVGATLMVGAMMVTTALFGAYNLGLYVGRGTPASEPPLAGVEIIGLNLKKPGGEWVEITIYETERGKVFVSSRPIPEPK